MGISRPLWPSVSQKMGARAAHQAVDRSSIGNKCVKASGASLPLAAAAAVVKPHLWSKKSPLALEVRKAIKTFLLEQKMILRLRLRTPCLFCSSVKLNPLQTVPKGLKGVKTEIETGRKKVSRVKINRSVYKTLLRALQNERPACYFFSVSHPNANLLVPLLHKLFCPLET